MDAHPTRVKPELGGKLIGAHRPAQARQAREQAGTRWLRQGVTPVDCIHPTPDEPDYDKVEMLYIDPEECIDCDACVEACPVDACFAEDQLPEEWQHFTQLNAAFYRKQTA